jgi:hypothetical protein
MPKTLTPETGINQRQKLLLVAVELVHDAPLAPLDVYALVRRAHDRFPEDFSLAGEGPPMADSNKVLAKLAGPSGLTGLGYLTAAGPRAFTITALGWRKAKSVTTEKLPLWPSYKPRRPPEPKRLADISESDKALVRKLAAKPIYAKLLRGFKLTREDATAFWGSSAVSADQLQDVEMVLSRTAQELSAKNVVDPALPSYAVCVGLLNMHRMLRAKFG